MGYARAVKVYLSKREAEPFNRIKEALGASDTSTFTYLLTYYAEQHNLIKEFLHKD